MELVPALDELGLPLSHHMPKLPGSAAGVNGFVATERQRGAKRPARGRSVQGRRSAAASQTATHTLTHLPLTVKKCGEAGRNVEVRGLLWRKDEKE